MLISPVFRINFALIKLEKNPYFQYINNAANILIHKRENLFVQAFHISTFPFLLKKKNKQKTPTTKKTPEPLISETIALLWTLFFPLDKKVFLLNLTTLLVTLWKNRKKILSPVCHFSSGKHPRSRWQPCLLGALLPLFDALSWALKERLAKCRQCPVPSLASPRNHTERAGWVNCLFTADHCYSKLGK